MKFWIILALLALTLSLCDGEPEPEPGRRGGGGRKSSGGFSSWFGGSKKKQNNYGSDSYPKQQYGNSNYGNNNYGNNNYGKNNNYGSNNYGSNNYGNNYKKKSKYGTLKKAAVIGAAAYGGYQLGKLTSHYGSWGWGHQHGYGFNDWNRWREIDGFMCRDSNDCNWIDPRLYCQDYELDFTPSVSHHII